MKPITINLLIKRLRVVRSQMCLKDREAMLHLINELENLERAKAEIEMQHEVIGERWICARCRKEQTTRSYPQQFYALGFLLCEPCVRQLEDVVNRWLDEE